MKFRFSTVKYSESVTVQMFAVYGATSVSVAFPVPYEPRTQGAFDVPFNVTFSGPANDSPPLKRIAQPDPKILIALMGATDLKGCCGSRPEFASFPSVDT